MSKPYELKEKDFQVLDFVVNYKKENDGNSPSIREICFYCEVTSTSVVNYSLMRLAFNKKIEFSGGATTSSRSIKVVGGKWTLEALKG